MQATLYFVGVKTVGTLCKQEDKEVRGFYKCVHTLFAHTECFYVIYSYTLLSTPSAPALSTFSPLFPLTHFSQPACVSYLHSYFLYTLFVERSSIWNSGAHSDFLSLSATLTPTLPFSLALTQRQISLPDCLPPHRTAPHLTSTTQAHTFYMLLYINMSYAHTHTHKGCSRLVFGWQKKHKIKHYVGWPKNAFQRTADSGGWIKKFAIL